MLFRRREEFLNCFEMKEWLIVFVKAQAVPMVLHGLYDTLLKRDMPGYALVVGVVSFAWLMVVMEWCLRRRAGTPAGGASRVVARMKKLCPRLWSLGQS